MEGILANPVCGLPGCSQALQNLLSTLSTALCTALPRDRKGHRPLQDATLHLPLVFSPSSGFVTPA